MTDPIRYNDLHEEHMIEALTDELIATGWPKKEAQQEAWRTWNNRQRTA